MRRLDEADFKRKYAGNDSQAERDDAFATIDAKVKASNCSPVAPDAVEGTSAPKAQNP